MGRIFTKGLATGLIGRVIGAMGLAIMLGSSVTPAEKPGPEYSPQPPFDGTLSVLTYNVKGLPWPLANSRSNSLKKIGERLRQLRVKGQQPEIVLLQEVFTDDARKIAQISGYRYVADGPSADDQSAIKATQADRQFAAEGSWLKGENIGKLAGSGLQILSDFPITAVYKNPFPDYGCAGYDCLSNKGAMLAVIDVEPLGTFVQIGNIHMNSKRHSRASPERRIFAYQRQVDATYDFFKSHYDERYPLVFGGDFNIGYMAKRADILFEKDWPIKLQNDGLRTLATRTSMQPDAQVALDKSADWQFSKSGRRALIQIKSVDVPFRKSKLGQSLSDHVGYTINYGLTTNSLALEHN